MALSANAQGLEGLHRVNESGVLLEGRESPSGTDWAAPASLPAGQPRALDHRALLAMHLGDIDGQTGQGEGPSAEVRKPGLTGDGCVRGQSVSKLPKLIFLPVSAFASTHAGDLTC